MPLSAPPNDLLGLDARTHGHVYWQHDWLPVDAERPCIIPPHHLVVLEKSPGWSWHRRATVLLAKVLQQLPGFRQGRGCCASMGKIACTEVGATGRKGSPGRLAGGGVMVSVSLARSASMSRYLPSAPLCIQLQGQMVELLHPWQSLDLAVSLDWDQLHTRCKIHLRRGRCDWCQPAHTGVPRAHTACMCC